MGVRIIRPQQRIHHIPGLGIETREALGGGAAGWWEVAGKTCYCAYQPKGAASLAASYTDLSGNARNCGPGNAPGWDAVNGWMFDVASAHTLDCGWAGPQGQTWSALVVFTNLTGSRFVFGHTDGGAYVSGYYSHRSVERRVYAGGTSATVGARIASGVSGYAGKQGYVNGLPSGSPMVDVSRTGAQNNMAVGSCSGAADTFMSVYVQAIVWYSDVLSDGEVATVSAAMAAL